MLRVHFIAIGGAAMHNLALALSQKKDYEITGSDDEIFEPSYSRLKEKGLLPDKMGWFPERIHSNLNAVILGMHAREDNPELLRAKELGLKIYSFPEYLYLQTRSKTRIVIGGSHGKTTTTAMILYVLKKLKMKADYMVGAQIEGFENMVSLSYEARIAVFEGDEYLTSPIDKRPKFHLYKPHIGVLTGIAWDHINVFPTFELYVEQFRKFVELMEIQGRFIYFSGDENLRKIAEEMETARRDIVAFPYNTPKYEIREGITYVKTRKGEIALKIFGEHNLQNMEAARLACKQIGVLDDDFYTAIADFSGASNRLQKIAETKTAVAFKDFAHSPSKLKATVKAVKKQYADRKLVACMELHTFSSLNEDFLPQYAGSMKDADIAFVYYNPEVIEHKKLKYISPEKVKEEFGGKNLKVFTDRGKLQETLQAMDFENSALLFMSSGNFSGINIMEFATELIEPRTKSQDK
ncbi:Mur ligase middle domain protein [uncultured Paludibacter sp.]|nr:Mur ligase middle domain protein [uncultured Paludibacter sp.]